MDFLNCSQDIWNTNPVQHLKELKSHWNEIPFVNANGLQNLPLNRLVRYRGIIKDMEDPEFYIETIDVYNEDTKKTRIKIMKYLDTFDFEKNELFDLNPNCFSKARYSFNVVEIPGLNNWVKEIEAQKYAIITSKPSTSKLQNKRNIDEEDDDEEKTKENSEESQRKKLCTSNDNKNDNNSEQKNPLEYSSDQNNLSLKVYENSESLKLNTMFECVGFLSVQNGKSIIHVLDFKKIVHQNPMLDQNSTNSSLKENLLVIRAEILKLFTQLLLGDDLAAEYLLYNLISKIYTRNDLLVIGKCCLNISNIPEGISVGKEVYSILEELVCKSRYLSMSLENMENLDFIPKKNYDSNKLEGSYLQLSDNTNLIIDETNLSEGELNQNGVSAFHALNDLIKFQKLIYDFTFYKLDFDTDLPCLILSNSKSILHSDFCVPLKPENIYLNTYHDVTNSLKSNLDSELKNQIREYLTSAMHSEFSLTRNREEFIQNEFVALKRKSNLTVDEFHNLMVLARLVSVSHGKRDIDEVSWKRALHLEAERKKRLGN